MSPDSIPQISLGTAVLVIFAACAGFVMLRGLARMLVGTVVLAISAWIGFVTWRAAPAWSLQYQGTADAWLTTALPIAAFLLSLFLLRWIAKSLVRPFGTDPDSQETSSSPVLRLATRLLLALIPTAIICLIGATAVHHTGTIAELNAYAEEKIGISGPTPAKFTQRLKQSVEAALPATWLRKLDPLADPERLALAKEITARAGAPREAALDPATGRPIPRAIIVDDPELQTLAREGKFGSLLRHPLLSKVLDDPKAPSR